MVFLNLIFDCASTPKEILTGLYFFKAFASLIIPLAGYYKGFKNKEKMMTYK